MKTLTTALLVLMATTAAFGCEDMAKKRNKMIDEAFTTSGDVPIPRPKPVISDADPGGAEAAGIGSDAYHAAIAQGMSQDKASAIADAAIEQYFKNRAESRYIGSL